MSLPSEEEWRPLPGYEGVYEVSSLGRVKSIPRPNTRGGIMKQQPRGDGYLDVELHCMGVSNKQLVHRLIALAFCPREEHQLVVRHMNDDRADNRAENLAWGTWIDNSADCLDRGRHFQASQTHCRRGHVFDAANTYRDRRGYRYCRACHRETSRKWQAASRNTRREARARG